MRNSDRNIVSRSLLILAIVVVAGAAFAIGGAIVGYGQSHVLIDNARKTKEAALSEGTDTYLKAAEDGDEGAQLTLAGKYMLGQGVPKSYPKAVKWLTKAAQQGNVKAQSGLALIYFGGEEGVQRNYTEAERWARKAALKGDPLAQTVIGELFLRGTPGIMVDYSEAAAWFYKAAIQGNAWAQGELGTTYIKSRAATITVQNAPEFKEFNSSASLDEEAFFWLCLSIAGGRSEYIKMRDHLANQLGFDKAVAIQERAQKWRPAK